MRTPRIPSPTGIYHVMLRGINRSNLFYDEMDYLKMKKILRTFSKPLENSVLIKPSICNIYAYCLMTNHIHLLIAEKDLPIGEIVRRIGIAYVSYFNKRRDRSGTLFEGRFRSEPVGEIEYFCKLLNYIHMNPVKAGICNKPEDYRWSSWREYAHPEKQLDFAICEYKIPFSGLSENQVREIVTSNNYNPEDFEHFVSPIERKNAPLTEEESISIVTDLLPDGMDFSSIKEMNKIDRLELANKALEKNISYTFVNKHIGISRATIYRKRAKVKTYK